MASRLLVIGLVTLFAGALSAQESGIDLEEQAIREAVDRVAPSVVRIETLGGREKVGEVTVGVALTRQMMYRNAAQPHPMEAHKVDSLAVFYTSLKDGKEGVRSFLEKRDPKFGARVSSDMPPFYRDWAK